MQQTNKLIFLAPAPAPAPYSKPNMHQVGQVRKTESRMHYHSNEVKYF